MIVPKKIVPHLWFDTQAKEAAAFYTSIFPDSRLMYSTVIRDTPSGDCDVAAFTVLGQEFMAISAGPLFTINPSISFVVSQSDMRGVDALWASLAEGGEVLMPLDAYPFSERYGWIRDRYGVSWQLILPQREGPWRPALVPFLAFTGANYGRAEEAIDFYVSVFDESKRGKTVRFDTAHAPEREGLLMYADFTLEGQWFSASESALHDFTFNEAVSLVVRCESQEEIDCFWARLSAVPEAGQCGWLKDRYGVSWQIVPAILDDMLRAGSPAQIERVTRAFLGMKKFDIAALRKAYAGD